MAKTNTPTKTRLAIAVAACLASPLAVQAEDAKQTENLETLVVTAGGYEQKVVDAPASISVISQEDLQKKPYANLLDAVKDIEGVDIGETTDKSGQGSVSIRGMGADYTLVLIDGKKQNNNGDIYPNDFGGLQFANIPPMSMVERIEVIRGPMSTLYGADAMGGVINIITKKVSNEWTGSISHSKTIQTASEWGNKDTTDVALMGALIKDTLGISLRGSYYDNKKSNPNWKKDAFNGEDSSKNNSSFGGNGKTMDNQNWTFGAGLTYTPNANHTIKADVDLAKQEYDNTEGSVGTVDSYETLYNNQRVGYAPKQEMERNQYSLFWDADWKKGKSTLGIHHIESKNLGRSLPLNAEQRKYINDNKSSWPDLDTAMQDPIFRAMMPRPVRDLNSLNTTVSGKYELPLDNHYLVTGVEYTQAELEDGVFGMESGGVGGKTKKYYQYSVFAQDDWFLTDALTLTFGGRYDKHEDFGSHVSPRAYAIYRLNPSVTFKGGVATGYKTPKTTDLYDGITGFGGQGTTPMVGNPDLKPEKSTNYEVAVYYEHPSRHSVNLTVFQNNFKDKIEAGDAPGNVGADWEALGQNPTQKQNIDKATIKGVEISGKYFIFDNLTLKANHTYLDSEMKDDDPAYKGKPLRSSPKHAYNITLDWQATQKFNTYLQHSGEIDRFNTRTPEKIGNTVLDDPYKDIYYKNFSIWNLGATYNLTENVTLSGRVNNLFDKDFMEYKTVAKGAGRTPWYYEEYSNINSGRSFWMSMNVNF